MHPTVTDFGAFNLVQETGIYMGRHDSVCIAGWISSSQTREGRRKTCTEAWKQETAYCGQGVRGAVSG